MMKPLFLLITIVLLSSCGLNYDGDAFYTVDGVVTDSLSNPLSNIPVIIRNKGGFNGSAISAESRTDNDGIYRLTFPSNNGSTEIGITGTPYSITELQEDFEEVHQNHINDSGIFYVTVTNENLSSYHLQADTIKIIPDL